MKILLSALLACGLSTGLAASAKSSKPTWFSKEQVRTHFEVVEKLNLKQTHLFDKLVKRFGSKDRYSSDEVLAIEVPQIPQPVTEDERLPTASRSGRPIKDSFTAPQAEEHFRVAKRLNPKAKGSLAALLKKYGEQPWYRASEIREVEKNGFEYEPVMMPRPSTPLVDAAEADAKVNRSAFIEGWKPLRLRQDWTDVMADEDRSQAGKVKVGDLVGATFSYSRDGNTDTESWATKGALIWPWMWEGKAEKGIVPEFVSLAPSISMQRISSNGSPEGEVDQVFYRLGVFATWTKILPWLSELEVRGAAVYLTDSQHDAEMGGFEFDLEPRILLGQTETRESKTKIGYKNILIPKSPLLEDGSDRSVLDYQFRVWLHVEGGDIQSLGRSWAATPDSFLRLGPTAQFRLNWNKLLFDKDFSLTAKYSFLATIDGPDENNSLFNLDATWVLAQDDEARRRISLTASYTRGGLAFTKEEVDALTIGLSVLF